MERLSGLDATFLYIESRSQLMHVSGIIQIDPDTVQGGYRFEDLRAELARRVSSMPEFRRKLYNPVINLDHPVWVEDSSFDIEAHVHRVAVPAPGGDKELAELCAHVAGTPLDRSKPLWEMWVIEGLANGCVGIMLRMHHAGVDGVTGAGLISQLCALTPEPPELDPKMLKATVGDAPALEIAAGGVKNVVTRPLSLVRLLPRTVKVPVEWMARSRRGDAMPAPFSAPRTSFNGSITGHRSIAFTQVDMDDVKTIKNHFGVKVNDVVLAAISGSLRRFLADRGELPDQPLVGMVPVSVHEAAVGRTLVEGTNKVSGMFTRLTTDIDDPVLRIQEVRNRTATSKEHFGHINANLMRSWAQFAPPVTMAAVMKLYADTRLADKHPVIHNLVISNVPGPNFPLYFLGGEIRAMYPLGPVFHGAGLNVTVFSSEGHLNLGVIACKEQVPDPWPIVESFVDDIKVLLETAKAEAEAGDKAGAAAADDPE